MIKIYFIKKYKLFISIELTNLNLEFIYEKVGFMIFFFLKPYNYSLK